MPNDLSSTPAPTLSMNDAKAEKATLERLILQLVQDYEERFECEVSTVHIDPERNEAKQWRAKAVRVTVNL